jgi:glutathione S-transferase
MGENNRARNLAPRRNADWGRRWIEDGFRALELLAEDARFLLGDEPTLADLCFVPLRP